MCKFTYTDHAYGFSKSIPLNIFIIYKYDPILNEVT